MAMGIIHLLEVIDVAKAHTQSCTLLLTSRYGMFEKLVKVPPVR
jgi:hypothetical protein